jgi:hypothetical protein
MALLILVALLIPPALAFLGVIALPVVVVADIGILFAAAWWFDRGRALGARDPFLDANRPDFPVQFTANARQLPTEAFEDPKDRPGAVK